MELPALIDRLRAGRRAAFADEPVVAAYLHGSGAAGRRGPFSDVDVALLLDEPCDDPLGASQRLGRLLADHAGVGDLDVRVLNGADLRFQGRAVQGGIVVFGVESPARAVRGRHPQAVPGSRDPRRGTPPQGGLRSAPTGRPTVERQHIKSGSPFEATIGFSRAVRVGDRVIVAGTAPLLPDGSCPDGVEGQARRCWEIVLAALDEAGGGPADVVRTRQYLTDAADAEVAGRVHGEIFGATRPASTIVVVAGLVDPRWRIEVEAEAVLT